jgi:hypothetical protein
VAAVNGVDGKTYIGAVDTGGILKKEGRQDLAISAYQGIKNVAAVEAYIAAAPGGDAPDMPVYLPVDIDLVPANWEDLLDAIGAANEYVALDLSDCAMHGTEFDPGENDTGESKIVSLVLPDAAVSIKKGTDGGSTFKNFTKLKSVSGSNVGTVGDYAFISCPDLTEVSFPAATSIGNYVFQNCPALTSVNLPAATYIGPYAFYGCAKLANVYLGGAVPTLGYFIFYSASSLTVHVRVPSGESAWAGETGTFTGDDSSGRWGNGFRGAGWTGSGFHPYVSANDININITVTITDSG